MPRGKFSTNQKHFPSPDGDTSSVCSGGVAKCRLFSQSKSTINRFVCLFFFINRTPRISQQAKKPIKDKDVGTASAATSNGGENDESTAAAAAIPGSENDAKNE